MRPGKSDETDDENVDSGKRQGRADKTRRSQPSLCLDRWMVGASWRDEKACLEGWSKSQPPLVGIENKSQLTRRQSPKLNELG